MARSRNRRPSESPKQFKGGENPFGNHSINVKTKSVLEDGLSLGDTRNGSSNLPFQAHRDSDCASEASSRPGEKSLSSHNTSIWETNSSRLGHTFASNKSAVAKRRTMAIGELEILSQELCQVSARNEKDTVGEVEEEELPPTQSSGPLLGGEISDIDSCYISHFIFI